MFEGAVAALLNRLLGTYVEDLDIESFNVGIFSGNAYLTDLKLKPEALYQLGLPIRIQIGLIGKVTLKIPWSNLTSQPILLTIEDVYVIVVPATTRTGYNVQLEKRLMRAAKRKILEDLENSSFFGSDLFDGFIASLVTNFHITVNNVHVRYEDNDDLKNPIACGICIQSLSMATTNSKWKPVGVTSTKSTSTVYQLVRIESFSVYLDCDAEPSLPNYPTDWEPSDLQAWKNIMYRALRTFTMHEREFQFLLKPFATRIKMIVNKSDEARVPRMLVDVMLQDIVMQMSEQQYVVLCRLSDSLKRITINRQYRRYRPDKTTLEDPKAWWKYAYHVALEYNVRPYTWKYISLHRLNYKRYKETFMRTLLRPNDTELKLDLQKYEDTLTIVNIVIAREHAKIELKKKEPERVTIDERESGNVRLVVNHEKMQDVSVMQFNGSESVRELFPTIAGRDAEAGVKSARSLKHVDRKYNFTLANCSFGLLNGSKEVLVITLTQFLASIETRPALSAFKISARAESFVIEGASSENELIPLITTDNVLTGNEALNFLAVDIEKNPLNSNFNFDISVTLESLEVIYHEYAMSEIIKFFNVSEMDFRRMLSCVYRMYETSKNKYLNLINSMLSRRLRINLKMDFKGPYIVIPENGSTQKGGNLLLLDMGRMTLKSELQAADVRLEDATFMELEELLYDRLRIDFADGQILFCHSGDDWREVRKRKDSENHLISKVQASITLSRSVRPEYRLLPRTKLNVSISTLKFNLSENKIRSIVDFLDLLSIPNCRDVETLIGKSPMKISQKEAIGRYVTFSTTELARIRCVIALSSVVAKRATDSECVANNLPDCNTLESERSIISSEMSDEDLEHWTRGVDLPGFDDNISPHNRVDLLLRFVIGELSFHLEHMTNGREQPYLVLRICTLYLEAAIMEYGPAVQFGIGTVLLADKSNAGVTGSYLELVFTDGSCEFVTVLYRKVRANCPDFKSHFRSIERSLIVDIANINVVFHRYAFLRLEEYCGNLTKTICRGDSTRNLLEWIRYASFTLCAGMKDDPPIPPGAIKLSYSTRLSTFALRLCDRNADLLELKIAGIESDCIYKANERMILRAHLRSLSIEDPSDLTLYTKILTTDEDKVFDLKYVRHTPKLYACSDIDANKQDEVMSDGSFKLSVGRINFVFISKMFHDCQDFFDPFLYLFRTPVIASFKNSVARSFAQFRNSPIKLRTLIDFQGPTFLLPRKKDVPSLLVFDMGILTIENFFKKNERLKQTSKRTNGNGSQISIIDNILLKLKSMTISRAVITLSGHLETQEPILEPVSIRFDAKRRVEYRSPTGFQAYGLCDARGSIDPVSINIGQKDLASILSIWEGNISKIVSVRSERLSDNKTNSLSAEAIPRNSIPEDAMVKKLEVFLAQNEQPIREIVTKLTLDGLQINLFADTEEVLSSPIRDLNHGLCRLTIGEIITSLDVYSDRSLNVKVSIRSCLLEDTRKDAVVIRKIIQSPSKTIGMSSESCISISMPPILDITFTRASAGDKCFDMLIEETRINLSVPFLIHVGHYFADSLPSEQVDKGVVNRGYESDDRTFNEFAEDLETTNARVNSLNCGESNSEDQPGTSISIRIRKPEILLFGNLKASNAHVILFQAELMIECSRHKGSSSIVCTLSNIRAKGKSQQHYLKQQPYWVLYPCDVEICKMERLPSHDVRVLVAVSSLNVHLSAGTVQTFVEILSEASGFLRCNDSNVKSTHRETSSHNDLWSQKKMSNIPYKQIEKEFPDKLLSNREHDYKQSQIFEVKPISIHVLLEMEDTFERLPIAMGEIQICAIIKDWDYKFQLESTVKLRAFCYNVEHGSWEPFVEPCAKDNNNYLPWELTLRMYQAEACMLSACWSNSQSQVEGSLLPRKRKRNAESSEDEINEDLVFIRPDHIVPSKINEPSFNLDHGEDSDSENDEDSEKLTRTFNRLFVRDSSEGEVSESDGDESSKCENDGFERVSESHCPVTRTTIETNPPAIYIIVHAEDMLNLSITPNTIATFDMILSTFIKRNSDVPIIATSAGKLSLHNDIGYISRIELLVKNEGDSEDGIRLVAAREFRVVDSPCSVPSSPDAESFSDIVDPISAANIDGGFADQDQSGAPCDQIIPLVLFPNESVVNIYKAVTEERLRITMEGFEDTLIYCPKRKECKLVPLRPVRHGVRYHLVVEVMTDRRLHRTITVRSPLQIRNETSYALGLYYKKQLIEKLKVSYVGEALNPFDDNVRMIVIEPDHTYNVPLYIAYHLPIHISPVHAARYQVSDAAICWKELSNNMNVAKDIYCNGKEDTSASIFGVKAICTEMTITTSINSRMPHCRIRILPPLVLDNRLPFALAIKVPSVNYEVRIEPGESINIHSMKCDNDPCKIIFEIPSYLGSRWTGTFVLTSELERKFVKMSPDNNEFNVSTPFVLCVELNRSESWIVVVYSQYWIVNKTGLPLHIREARSSTIYEIPGEDLILFSQKRSRRRVVRLRAQQSGWSPSFGLDAIGCTAMILCRDVERRRKYRIQADITASRLCPLFTKIVTFLPNFLVDNKTKRTLRFMEENEEADLWNDLLPGQGIPFWPYTDSMKMRVKWNNSQLVSQHFDVTKIGRTVLRMDNGTALCVEVEGGESSPFNITFQKYQNGDAPVRVDNFCDDLYLKINQFDMGQAALLSPFQSLLYTWDDPTKTRQLVWNVYNNKTRGYTAQFQMDGYGRETVSFRTLKRSAVTSQPVVTLSDKLASGIKEVTPANSMVENYSSSDETDSETNESEMSNSERIRKDKAIVYWVSFVEKQQRVLLFTQDENIFLKARSLVEPEASKSEVFIGLVGIGISIMTKSNEKERELAYVSMTDSAAHWELCVGDKWKTLTLELSTWMEDKRRSLCKRAQLENFIHVDFAKMHMTKPFFGKLRRTHSPGMWLHCRKSTSYTYLRLKIHRLQIDNQLHDAALPIVLHSDAKRDFIDNVGNRKLKPCLEFSFLKQRKATHDVYKNINIVLKEFSVNLHDEFLVRLTDDLTPKKIETKPSVAARLRMDLSNIYVPLFCTKDKSSNLERRNLVEHLYISPIRIRLKLLASADGSKAQLYHALADYRSFVRFLFEYARKGPFERSADLRLPHYERNSIVMDNKHILSDIKQAYTSKIMQQFNVLILSLTVVGNPYGYNFKLPGDAFYDTYSLSVYEDPVTEKLNHDIACLLGYATMDATQSSILTFDDAESYVLHPREKLSDCENTEIPLSIILADRSFSIGVELEMSGLVVKPVNDVYQEELKCFLKTLGKGILDLIKRENISSNIRPGLMTDIIKRAQEMGYEFISRVRLPRYINPYLGVDVYSIHKATGMHLLNTISKGHYANTDTYWAHVALSNDGKRVALVSLRRIFFIEKKCASGSWHVEWTIDINRLVRSPVINDNKLILHVDKNEDISCSPVSDWYLESENQTVLEWLCRKIETAIVLNMENSICPGNEA